MADEKVIMENAELKRKISRLASEIIDDAQGEKDLVLIGIRTLGVRVAELLREQIRKETGKEIPMGILDISLYRDDFSEISAKPKIKETIIDFDLTGKHIVLVDDVIWSGRTVRAALDQIMDFGRPRKVRLCVLVDRGQRELPVEPTYTGKKMKASRKEWIELTSRRGKEEVLLVRGKKNREA